MAVLDDLVQQIKDPELRDRIQKEADTIKNKRFKRLDFSKGLIRQKVLAAMDTNDIDNIFRQYGFIEEQ